MNYVFSILALDIEMVLLTHLGLFGIEFVCRAFITLESVSDKDQEFLTKTSNIILLHRTYTKSQGKFILTQTCKINVVT
jgi:hypothetical protein